MKRAMFFVAWLALVMGSVRAATETVVDGVYFTTSGTQATAPAATFAAGETEVTAKANVKSTIGGVEVANQNAIYLAAEDGAVIKVKAADGAKAADFLFGLKLDAGTVTLDLTDLGELPFKFGGTLWVGDDATLVIKGRNALDFGYVETSNNYFPAGLRAQTISFVDANGDAYAEPGTIHFSGSFTEIRLPSNVSWDVADDSVAYVYRSVADGIISRYAEGGVDDPVKTFVVKDFDLVLIDPCGAENVDFQVNSGRELRFSPRVLRYEVGYPLNGNSLAGADYSQSVGLNHNDDSAEMPELSIRYNHTLTVSSDISGHGKITYSNASMNSGESVSFTGVLTQTGEFVASCTTAKSPLAVLTVVQAAPGADGIAVTLGAGCQLRLDPTEAVSGTIGSLSGPENSLLKIGKKASVTLASAPQNGISIVPIGDYVPVVARGWALTAGDYLVDGYSEGSAQFAWTLSDELAAVTPHLDWSPTCRLYYQPTIASGVRTLPDMTFPAARGELTLAAVSGEKYANVPAGVRVYAASGVSATVVVDDDDEVVLEAESGATLRTERPVFDYSEQATYWFDAANAESYTQTKSGGTGDPLYVDKVYKSVDVFSDCRSGYEDLVLRNDKYTLWNSSINPYIKTAGLNDRDYLAVCPGNRRMAFWSATAIADMDSGTRTAWAAECSTLMPEYCIMVFGSQEGGGCGVLGEEKGYFIRSGSPTARADVTKDTPIFANAIPLYVDGKSVDGQTTGLSGGWQILSFPTYGKRITGLGTAGSFNKAAAVGNANYAEILFFDHELSDHERVTVERYLASKWGLTDSYHDSTVGTEAVTVEPRGTGTITLGTKTVVAAGSFHGTLDTAGQEVSFAVADLPPTSSSVITESSVPVNWFDPSQSSTLQLNAGRVVSVFDVREDYRTTDKAYLNTAGRYGWLVDAARGYGTAQGWIDFSPYYHGGATANGRSMRFNKVGSGSSVTTIEGAPAAKTVIMVQDSSKGGGTPFLDTVAGSTLSQRSPSRDKYGQTLASKPIWVDTSATTLAAASTYLNGTQLDGTKVGFTGAPEVLSVVNDTAFTVGVFGNLYYLNGHAPNDIDEGEIMGEIVIYDAVLSSPQRQKVEAYLAWKWFGSAINGYANFTGLNLAGSGTVKVNALNQLPQAASGFAGTLDLTSFASLDFGIEASTGTVAGQLATSGTFAFPAAVTLNVDFASNVRSGKYTLLEAADGLDDVVWTPNYIHADDTHEIKLNVSATRVEVEVVRNGLSILFY